MERYESYKDSGVKWIGEIPGHWEVTGLKRISSIILGKMLENAPEGQGLPYLCAKDVHMYNIDFSSLKKMHFSKKEKERYEIKRGDMLVVEGGAAGSSAIVKSDVKDVYIQNSIMITRCNNSKMINDYACYVLNSMILRGYSESICNKATIMHFTKEKLGDTIITVPPIKEQITIVNYLDSVTSKIDEAISQQQKMIDLLNERKQIIIQNAVTKGLDPNAKMKDSGVEWIGEIPEDWEVKKLKHVCQAFGRIGFRGYSTTDLVDEGEGCITLSPSNMRDGQMQYEKCTYLSWEKYEESPEIKIHNGDILFVKTGSTYGKSSLVEDLPLEATINPQLLVFKNFTCNNKFLVYVLQTTTIKTQVELSVIGGTIPTISQQKILNYVFPYPTVNVQDDIVAFIENKTTPICEAIKVSERQIALLQERKQIIINDVVTGKVKVV